MSKPQAFKTNIKRPTDQQIIAASHGIPFKHCPSCGASISASQKYCYDCTRIVELGLHKRVYQPSGTDNRMDSQGVQSYPSDKNHSGYSDTISNKKIGRQI
jgi:hypothetical protein